MRGPAAALVVMAMVLAGPAAAQQTSGQPIEAEGAAPLLTSPIPRVRVLPQADPDPEPQPDPAQQAGLTQPPAADPQDPPDPPGPASQVRVVYGSGQSQEGPKPETQRAPTVEDGEGAAPPGVRLEAIYRGVSPFVALQVLGVALVLIFPLLATWLPVYAFGTP